MTYYHNNELTLAGHIYSLLISCTQDNQGEYNKLVKYWDDGLTLSGDKFIELAIWNMFFN